MNDATVPWQVSFHDPDLNAAFVVDGHEYTLNVGIGSNWPTLSFGRNATIHYNDLSQMTGKQKCRVLLAPDSLVLETKNGVRLEAEQNCTGVEAEEFETLAVWQEKIQ